MEIVEKKGTSCLRLYRTPSSNRSVCDIVFCDFSCQELQKYVSHAAIESNQSVCDIVLCDFLAKSYKSSIASDRRSDVCDGSFTLLPL